MPLGEGLSHFGTGQILAHQSNYWSITDIAKEMNRSRALVIYFLWNPDA